MSTLPLLIQSSFFSLNSFGPAEKFEYEKFECRRPNLKNTSTTQNGKFEYKRPNGKWARYLEVEYEKVKLEMSNIKGLT